MSESKRTAMAFSNLIWDRIRENEMAFHLVAHSRLTASAVSILRQELDSMVRVIFLLAIDDLSLRTRLMEDTFNQRKWTLPSANGKNKPITDKMMVDFADKLHGWSQIVYKFGCAVIHLSDFHQYKSTNPFASLSKIDKENIEYYLHSYHMFNASQELSIQSVHPLLPDIYRKIKDNLACYLRDLEEEKTGCFKE